MIFFILIALISKSPRADYLTDLNRVQKRGQMIEQKLNEIGGYSSPFSNENRDTKKQEEGSGSLFAVHSSTQTSFAPIGKILFGKLYNRLIVGGSNSPVIVVLDQNQGKFSSLKAIGEARPSGTEGRIDLEFKSIILLNQKSITVSAVGLDQDGAIGIPAEIFSSKLLSVAGAMGSSFLSGLAASQQTQSPTAFGFSQTEKTGRNALLQGLAQSAADQSKRLIEESTKEKPILVAEPGTPITIFIQEEVNF